MDYEGEFRGGEREHVCKPVGLRNSRQSDCKECYAAVDVQTPACYLIYYIATTSTPLPHGSLHKLGEPKP